MEAATEEQHRKGPSSRGAGVVSIGMCLPRAALAETSHELLHSWEQAGGLACAQAT